MENVFWLKEPTRTQQMNSTDERERVVHSSQTKPNEP